MKKGTRRMLQIASPLVAIPALAYALFTATSGRDLERAYAELEAAGRPMRAEEIVPAPVADADNAALLYESAALLLKAVPVQPVDGRKNLLNLARRAIAGPADAAVEAELRDLLATPEVERAIGTIEEGSRKSRCVYAIDYSQGAGILLPHVTDLRLLTDVVCARARFAAEAGRAEAALDDLDTALRVSDALREEPILISQLIRVAQFHTAFETLQRVAAVAPVDGECAARLDDRLRPFENPAPLVRAMDGERLLLGEWAFRVASGELAVALGPDGSSRWLRSLARIRPLRQADHAAYLRAMGGYASLAAAPYSADEGRRFNEMVAGMPRWASLTPMLTPALGNVKASSTRCRAEAAVARAGLAALSHRRERGAWPAELPPDGDASFADPFTGAPLRYRVEGDRAIVYSVGPDQADDGGDDSAMKPNDRKDVVWRLAPPRDVK